jgi:hypothetical protein
VVIDCTLPALVDAAARGIADSDLTILKWLGSGPDRGSGK